VAVTDLLVLAVTEADAERLPVAEALSEPVDVTLLETELDELDDELLVALVDKDVVTVNEPLAVRELVLVKDAE